MEYTRVQVANRLATDGESWVDTFSRENSGTYNNGEIGYAILTDF